MIDTSASAGSLSIATVPNPSAANAWLEERQRMEELLNKAEELAHIGSWEIDAAGYMPRLSPNMHRLLGIAEEFHGTFEDFRERFVHPDDRARLAESFARFISGTGENSIEFRVVRADGEVRDVVGQAQVVKMENGQIVRCYGTTTDITERKQAAQNLAESEQRYRLLADNATDLITRIRSDGVANYVSPACRQILGYEPAELLGRSVFALIAPEDQEPMRRLVDSLLAGEDRPSVPYRAVRKDGSIVWLESKAKLLVDDKGRRELVCVTRDITERRILQEQVSQAQRLEAIGRLAGGIAHDFNNILTVINGYAEVLELRFPAGDPGARYVANILEAGQRAAQLTRQLLTYSRKQLVTRGSLVINEVLQRLVSLLRPLLGETIELRLHMEPALCPIMADIGQFEQLVMNLSINSRDAMPEGGVLTWETANVVFAPDDPRPLTLASGRYVRFSVIDTGVGMDESVKSRLFEPFFTTKDVGQGTGLGLATVYATVEQWGGAIEVESAVNAGTRFDLYFPSQEPSEVAVEHPSAASQSPPLPPADGQPRILVVEDDPQVRSLVELTLGQHDLAVTTATNGEDAMHLGKSSEPFDLLLTDVVMRGMNGRELADRLRSMQPKLKVIFMSGHTEDAMVRQGVLHDEVHFLQKPFTAEDLLRRVREALTRLPG
jgi:PAS domain S-box-containing protein